MQDLLDRIVAAAPDPLRLTDDEFAKLSAYLLTAKRRPQSSITWTRHGPQGDATEIVARREWDDRVRAWRCTLEYNRELRAALAATAPAQDAAGTKAGKAKGGRPKVTAAEAKRRKTLIAEWRRAQSAGESMKGFCQDRGCTIKHLERCIAWDSQQSRRNATT
jgi:hypothetical protein